MRIVRSAVAVAALAVLVAGCGNAGTDQSAGSTSSGHSCMTMSDRVIQADLDGDGRTEEVSYAGAAHGCPAMLTASVGGSSVSAEVDGVPDLVTSDLVAVRVPGRKGALILLRQAHPRGGFQARLYGYAAGKLEELTSDGKPVFGFVATDAPTQHVAAGCVAGGFTVTEAVTHQPIGVAAAWDVYRTSYAVDGNRVTAGRRTEIAQSVLDTQLPARYPEVAADKLFVDC
jgi:hypothetical protein